MIVFKNFGSILIALSLLGCGNPNRAILEDRGTKHEVQYQEHEAMQNFLAKFKEIAADTIKVISSLDVDDERYRFRGVLLDSNDAALLPDRIAGTYASDKRFYACFKFVLDDTHTGLIIRTPSMYAASSLKLFVVNTSSNTIIEPYLELAETVIQMVEYWDKKTFIVKDKKSPTTFLMWEHQNEDTTEIFYTIRFAGEKFDTVRVVTK